MMHSCPVAVDKLLLSMSLWNYGKRALSTSYTFAEAVPACLRSSESLFFRYCDVQAGHCQPTHDKAMQALTISGAGLSAAAHERAPTDSDDEAPAAIGSAPCNSNLPSSYSRGRWADEFSCYENSPSYEAIQFETAMSVHRVKRMNV